MAEVTEAQDTKITKEPNQEEEVIPEEESTEASAGHDTTGEIEDPKQDEEFEVVRESKGSQPKPAGNLGISKRINKLNAKVETAVQGEEKANAELILANERTRLLQIQLDQQNETQDQPVLPKPDDFDDGVHDPEYIKQVGVYQNAVIEYQVSQQVKQQVQEATKQTVQTQSTAIQSQELKRKQIKHYEQADKLGMKNYAEVEDKAIEILGTKTVNVIIDNFTEDSHILLGYLGLNPGEAQRIAEKLKINPIQGVAELGALRSELKIKPKTKITPDPDNPLPGGSPSGANDSDAKAEKLLANATKSGSKADLDKYFEHQNKRRKEAEKARAG